MNFHFNFYSKRFHMMALSAVIALVGLVFVLINGGFNLDIQFEGGTHLEIPMKSRDIHTGEIESYIRGAYGKNVTAQIQQVFTPNAPDNQSAHLIIKASKSETFNAAQINSLQEYLDEQYGLMEGERVNIRTVEPYIGQEMLNKGLLAILIASALILLYMWVRFSVMSGLAAAVCATVGLIHDALIVLAVYAIFRLPINEMFIAAILTILAYSLNDTIIVYDRIRENSQGAKKLSYIELTNSSLNQTLTRTINTDATTLICVVTVYVFAIIFKITTLQDFSLPLIIGIISGSYSTLFIATQFWAMWQIKAGNRKIAVATAAAASAAARKKSRKS